MKSIKTKFKAFTLAEVMIVIGIIGIVAAITIPTLMNNANSKKFSSQFKKTISTMSQAALGSVARYDIDFAAITANSAADSCSSNKLADGNYAMCALLNSSLSGAKYEGIYGNLKANLITTYSVDFKTSGFSPNGYLLYTLADGSMVGFNPNLQHCSLNASSTISAQTFSGTLGNCLGFIDVNGVKGPNKETACVSGDPSFSSKACVLPGRIDDVFPIFFHDTIAEPATNAGVAVLKGEPSTSGDPV